MRTILSSKWFHIGFGFAVSALLIIWMIQAIDWPIVWQESKRMNALALIPMTLLFALHMFLRAFRWRYLLAGGHGVPLRLLFDGLLIGNFATFVLPLRAGEFIRPLIVSREAKPPISFPASFTSVVIERFFDLAIVLATFAAVVPFIPTVPEWAHSGALALGVLCFAILLFIAGGILLPQRLIHCMQFFLRPLPAKVQSFFLKTAQEFITGAQVIRKPATLATVFVLSIAVWLSNYLFIYASLEIVDIPNSMLLAVSLSVIVALAVAAPSAPGFVGVIQVACVATFLLWGISKELAVAYAVLVHVFQYIFICGYGFFALAQRQLSLTQLQNASQSKT